MLCNSPFGILIDGHSAQRNHLTYQEQTRASDPLPFLPLIRKFNI